MKNIVSFVLCSLPIILFCGCFQEQKKQSVEDTGPLIAILQNYEKDSIVASNKQLGRFFYTIQFVQSDSCLFMKLVGDDFSPVFFVMNSSDEEEIEYYKTHGYSNDHIYGYIDMGDNRILLIHECNIVDSLVNILLPTAVIKHDKNYQDLVFIECCSDNPTYKYSIDDSLRFSFVERIY